MYYEYRVISDGERYQVQGRHKIWLFYTLWKNDIKWEDCIRCGDWTVDKNLLKQTTYSFRKVEDAQELVDRRIGEKSKKKEWFEIERLR